MNPPEPDKKILKYAEHIEGRNREFFRNACKLSLEGIVSKKKGSFYTERRVTEWVKVKCRNRQKFVIGGYSEAGGRRKGFGALLLGVYDKNGRLIYTGRVGAGFDERTRVDLFKRLKKIGIKNSPFFEGPGKRDVKGIRWVKPGLVAEIEFREWTKGRGLRAPSYLGLREDKKAGDARLETPQDLTGETGGRFVNLNGVRITKPDQVLYPDMGITKKDLAEYYLAASGFMLPHLSGRPIMLVRCPEGYDKECFVQILLISKTCKDV